MMELLAPAGSIDQAKGAIDSGANAVYGGLQQWNARSRAKNFAPPEYKDVLAYCHAHQVTFHLTLNTLLYDHELAEIMELFHAPEFPLPDAVIVADLGMIRVLGHEFPDLPLHASTQFGAATVDDLRLLEELGVSRAILARELTLREIEMLRKNTIMELEVFVFGSQCVGFSGQCQWGGFLRRGSGNRGSCTGMCRDVYEVQGKQGQFFYPQDINALGLLPQLEQAGVQSVKIEGRLRSAEETSAVVRQFRAALDHPEPLPPSYTGYLHNDLPVKGMFHGVNPRTAQYLDGIATKITKPGVTKETLHFLQGNVASSSGNPSEKAVNAPSFSLHRILDGLDKKCCILETDCPEDIYRFYRRGYHRFLFAPNSLCDLAKIKDLCYPGLEVTYKLPILDFAQNLEDILAALEGEAIMVTRLSHLYRIRGHNFKAIFADYSLNLWNTPGMQWAQEQGVQQGTVHPETVGIRSGPLFPQEQMILAGKVPLAYTRACFHEIGLCPIPCREQSFRARNMVQNCDIEVYCHNGLSYRTIRPAEPLVLDTTSFISGDLRVVLTGMIEKVLLENNRDTQ